MAETTETTRATKRKAPAPKGAGKKACSVQGCKRAYRAKGLCFFHYKKWRRDEIPGRPGRFGTCSKEGCRKKVVARGMCQEHLDAWRASRKSAGQAAAEVPAAAPAAT